MASAPRTPAPAPKTMSSKLLTMKFMQRAAAAASASESEASSVPSPETSRKLSKKEREQKKLLKEAEYTEADKQAVQAALAAEEAKKQAALDRAATAAGDTRWVLSFQDGNAPASAGSLWQIIPTSYANVDADSDYAPQAAVITSEGQDDQMVGRRQFNVQPEKATTSASRTGDDEEDSSDDSSDDSSSDSSSSESESGDGVDDLIRKEKKQQKQRRKEQKALKRKLQQEKEEEEELRNMKSISNAGASGFKTKQACHQCGEVGHLKAQCPKRGRGRESPFGKGNPRKKARLSS